MHAKEIANSGQIKVQSGCPEASQATGGLAGKLPPILILLITFLAFLPVLVNDFIEWDNKTLVNNPNYRGLYWSQLRWMFTDFQTIQYQPLSWMTLGLDHLLWWMDPFGYHLTSLLLHAASALVFYFVTLRLLTLGRFSPTELSRTALRVAAGFAALVFAIHPLRVEPVAWASARGDILSGLFFLVSFLCYLRTLAVPETDRRWQWWMTASVLTYGFSLLSNATGMMLPIILLLLDIYPLGRLGGSPGKWFGPDVRQLYWQKAPFFLLALGATALTVFAAHQGDAVNFVGRHGVGARAAHILFAPAFYLWKTIVPLGFSPLYELPVWPLALGGATVVAISVRLVVKKRSPALLVSWVCYIALLLPALAIGRVDLQQISDRHSYLSCLPWAIWGGMGLLYFWRLWIGGWRLRWTLTPAGGLAVLVLVGLGTLTWKQVQVWHDSERLWRNAVAVNRSSSAHNNLAILLEAQEKIEEAIEHYKQVVQIDPLRWDTHEKAALLLKKEGKTQEAIEHYRSAVQINPAATEARHNLAVALAARGDFGEAIEQFRKILELNPQHAETHLKLGTILAAQGFRAEAAGHFQRAVTIDPNDADPLLKLGLLSAAQGNLDRAIDYFRQALRIKPYDAEIHTNLGRALAEQGKKNEALKHYEEALRILRSSPAPR